MSSAVTGQSDIFKCYIRNGVASDSRGDGSQHYLHLSSIDGGPIGVFVQAQALSDTYLVISAYDDRFSH